MNCACVCSSQLGTSTTPHLPKFMFFRHNIDNKSNPLVFLGFKYSGNNLRLQTEVKTRPQKLCHRQFSVIRCEGPQNADFPRYYSKKEKKPFPIPIVELRRNARQRMKDRKGKPKALVPPPKNGLLVKSLIPVAYSVYNARIRLINNLKKLLKVVPVHACKWCNEIHVGPVGHPFKSCRGPNASIRRGHHEWTNPVLEDILVPVDAYHLFDRLGRRIPHEDRFSIPRVPAVVELCIQAGVDLPEFPTKRRRKPIIRISKSEFVDADESELPDPDPYVPKESILSEENDNRLVVPSNADEIVLLAEETLEAWEKMRVGANRLMKMYPVRVCGYCPEVHVGGSGHMAQNCGAHKHQQRNGQHGWQSAVLDDFIPPRYVWHVPDLSKPELQRELRNFYGQAPAVVEICVQGGAAAPERYQPTMRLNVGIPSTVKEAEMRRMAGSQNDQAGPKLPNSGKHTDGVLQQRSKPPIRPLKIVLGGVAFVYIGYLTLCPFGPLRRKSETTALEAAIIEKKRPRN